jgi:Haem-binding domain
MRKAIRIILVVLLVLLIIIQFFRPAENIAVGIAVNDISSKYTVPPDVDHLLKVACYDCHSNNTRYPWYWKIQPVTWFMNGHIEDAKRGLNFSAFTSHTIGQQYRAFNGISKEVKKGDMPLSSYTYIHKDAILSDQDKLAIENWAAGCRKNIEGQYPPDSLVSPKPSPQQQ